MKEFFSMTKGRTKNFEFIKPLFLSVQDSNMMGNPIFQFVKDDYNKAIGEALIDAKNDEQAIMTFLQEYNIKTLQKHYALTLKK